MNRQVLLVEDEPSQVLTLTNLLKSEGYQVKTTSDGQEGFRLASEGHFDLIILDVMLLGKNGFDMCRDLRWHDMTTPIILLTAHGQVIVG